MSAFDVSSYPYAVELDQLGSRLASKFVPLRKDEGTDTFVREMKARPHGYWDLQLAGFLSAFLTTYDVHGKLGLYQMHLLSAEQWQDLLGSARRETLLDVGAGAGYVTEQARALFEHITCTETSGPLAKRLRARGFTVHEQDLGERPLNERFDVVACFNVLDRTAHPKRLLSALIAHLAPWGTLLLSVPLPLSPHVHVKGGTIAPEERLPVSATRFEHAARELSEQVLEKAGLVVERFARVPYLSRGDRHCALYALDDALFVCRVAPDLTDRT